MSKMFSEAFVTRLLSRYSSGQSPTILEGGLPEDFKSLPLPEGTTVVGSQFVSTRLFKHASIVLDSTLSPETFRAQLGALLEKDGWQRRNQPYSFNPLFVSRHGPEPPYPHEPFYTKDNWQLVIELMDRKTPAGQTDVRLQLESSAHNVEPFEEGGLLEQLPQLLMPEGAEMRGHGGGWGAGNATYQLNFVSGWQTAELLEHFASQLRANGWQEVESLLGKGAGMFYYEKRVENEHYDAHLLLINTPNSYLYKLLFEASARGEESGHSMLILSNPEIDGDA